MLEGVVDAGHRRRLARPAEGDGSGQQQQGQQGQGDEGQAHGGAAIGVSMRQCPAPAAAGGALRDETTVAATKCRHPGASAVAARYMPLNRCAYRRLTVSVSLRPLSDRKALPDSSRRALAMQRACTTVPRCTCQKTLRVQLRQQLAQRHADQVFALGGDHAQVLVGGLEVDAPRPPAPGARCCPPAPGSPAAAARPAALPRRAARAAAPRWPAAPAPRPGAWPARAAAAARRRPGARCPPA